MNDILTITIGDNSGEVYPNIIEHDGFKTSIWVVPKDRYVFFKGTVPEDKIKVVSLNEEDTFEIHKKGYLGYIKANQDSSILFLVRYSK